MVLISISKLSIGLSVGIDLIDFAFSSLLSLIAIDEEVRERPDEVNSMPLIK